jgi:Transglycosylase SLT domain
MRNSRSRARKLAAAGMLGGLLLAPSMIAGGPGLGFLPVAVTGLGNLPLPVPGDLLRTPSRPGALRADDLGASGRLPEAHELPRDALADLAMPSSPSTGAGPLASVPPGSLGIPGIVLEAYRNAAQRTEATNARCGVSWPVLAAIGRIESGHARGGRVDAKGTTLSPILGPQLSGGPGVAAIRDSDGGRLDADTVWDRAVGPMQFIPTTWARYAVDGNSDGNADPHNVFDSTLAAAHYLCAGGGDLRDPVTLASAIFRYNHSESYVRTVLAWASAYATGVTPLPSAPGPVAPIPPVAAAPLPGAPVGLPPAASTPPPITTPGTTTSTAPSTSASPPPSPSPSPTTTQSPTSPPTTTTPSQTTTTTTETCPTTTTATTTETTTATSTPPPGCPVDAPASEEPTATQAETTTSMPAT